MSPHNTTYIDDLSHLPEVLLHHSAITSQNGLKLMAVIHNHSQNEGYCWAGNAYLAKQIGCCERTITRLLTRLEDAKLITISTTLLRRELRLNQAEITLLTQQEMAQRLQDDIDRLTAQRDTLKTLLNVKAELQAEIDSLMTHDASPESATPAVNASSPAVPELPTERPSVSTDVPITNKNRQEPYELSSSSSTTTPPPPPHHDDDDDDNKPDMSLNKILDAFGIYGVSAAWCRFIIRTFAIDAQTLYLACQTAATKSDTNFTGYVYTMLQHGWMPPHTQPAPSASTECSRKRFHELNPDYHEPEPAPRPAPTAEEFAQAKAEALHICERLKQAYAERIARGQITQEQADAAFLKDRAVLIGPFLTAHNATLN